ncbi:MAG TPA: hypothetical protein VGD67_18550 [Pseudonocardiaceae bacterium]
MRINVDEADWDDDQRLLHRGVPYTGEVYEAHANGRLVALTNYVAGREDGPDWMWYPDGTLRSQGQSRSGRAVGLVRDWHPNGTLAEERLFDEHGDLRARRRWSDDGTLLEDRTF